MNIDDMNKEQLLEYKQLLQELQNYKTYRNISAALTILSTFSFVYFARNQELKQLAISALISIICLNFTAHNNKEIYYTKKKL